MRPTTAPSIFTATAFALLVTLLAPSSEARAQDDLPLPPTKARSGAETTKGPAPAPPAYFFTTIVFTTGDATMTLEGNGDYTVDYPGGLVGKVLASVGVPFLTHASGQATPAELAAIQQPFGTDAGLESAGFGEPITDNQVLGRRPFSIEVNRLADNDADASRIARPFAHFDNDGGLTSRYGVVNAVSVLNGLVDRATDGYVYGGAEKSVTGLLSAVHDSGGSTYYVVTDDSGKKFILEGSESESGGSMNPPTHLQGYPVDARSAVGTRVVVHGLPSGDDAGLTRLVTTRALEPADPARASASVGITGALDHANAPK